MKFTFFMFVIWFIIFNFCNRTDPTSSGWATSWMPGIAVGILGISLISGAIFALYWARKNKRNMKAAYPGEKIMTFCF